MKSALFAGALLFGGAALAQTDPQTPTTMPAPSGQTVAPDNSAPERDARNIPVVSDPATAPPGFNENPQVGGTGASPTSPPPQQPATENYPPCSRTVTDNCVQASERGRSPNG